MNSYRSLVQQGRWNELSELWFNQDTSENFYLAAKIHLYNAFLLLDGLQKG